MFTIPWFRPFSHGSELVCHGGVVVNVRLVGISRCAQCFTRSPVALKLLVLGTHGAQVWVFRPFKWAHTWKRDGPKRSEIESEEESGLRKLRAFKKTGLWRRIQGDINRNVRCLNPPPSFIKLYSCFGAVWSRYYCGEYR